MTAHYVSNIQLLDRMFMFLSNVEVSFWKRILEDYRGNKETWKLSWKKIIKPSIIKGKILAIILYHTNSWLFLFLRSVEIGLREESSALATKKRVDRKRKKKVLKKVLKITKQKEPKKALWKSWKILSGEYWMSLFLSGFTKDLIKVLRFQNNLWKKISTCMTTWSKEESQVKIFRQSLASSEDTWTDRFCDCDKKQIRILVSFVLHVRRFAMKYQYNAVDIMEMQENRVWTDMVSFITVEDSSK